MPQAIYIQWYRHPAVSPLPIIAKNWSPPTTGDLIDTLYSIPDQGQVDIIIQGRDGFCVEKDEVAKFGQTWQHLVILLIFYDDDINRLEGKAFQAFDLQILTQGILRPAENILPTAYQELLEFWGSAAEARHMASRNYGPMARRRNADILNGQ